MLVVKRNLNLTITPMTRDSIKFLGEIFLVLRQLFSSLRIFAILNERISFQFICNFFLHHNLYIHSEINIAVEGVFYMPIRYSRVQVRQSSPASGERYLSVMCFSYVLCFTHFVLCRHRFEILFFLTFQFREGEIVGN